MVVILLLLKWLMVKGQRIHSASPYPDFDGNTVDLDREMAKMAENQLMYNASIRMLTHQFRMLKTAITEGKGAELLALFLFSNLILPLIN